jgi:hypothetical protein
MSGTFLFDPGIFPALPPTMTTGEIETKKTFKFINDQYRLDVVNFRASKETYRRFALAVLAVVFCPSLPELRLELIGENSQIKSILIRYQGTSQRAVLDYRTKPVSFEYYPNLVCEHPWRDRRAPEPDWPEFRLVYSGTEDWKHWDERDRIEGFGSDDASVLLASLLLDFGREENAEPCVRLETPLQYGGVSKFSPEIRFHLPNSQWWSE